MFLLNDYTQACFNFSPCLVYVCGLTTLIQKQKEEQTERSISFWLRSQILNDLCWVFNYIICKLNNWFVRYDLDSSKYSENLRHIDNNLEVVRDT